MLNWNAQVGGNRAGRLNHHSLMALVQLIACAVFTFQFSNAYAQTDTDSQGRIHILSAELFEAESEWQLVASAEIQLSPVMRQGLNSGVPLHFILRCQIQRPRTLLPAKKIIQYEHRYSLTYYELTRHYRLQSINSSQSRNFRSLIAALDELGRLSGVVVPKPDTLEQQLDGTEKLVAMLNLRLDDKALPLPLQPLFSTRWKLASEDFAWPLN